MSGPLVLHELDETDPSAWGWLPGLRRRIVQACATLCRDTPAELFWTQLLKWWVAPETKPFVRLWVAVDGQGEIRAHAVGYLEMPWGQPTAFLHQVVVDEGVDARSIGALFLQAMLQWQHQLEKQLGRQVALRFCTERPVRAWARLVRALSGGKVRLDVERSMVGLTVNEEA